ncbi:MAG TPA: hypothetical protein P5571_09125 [Candidatus Krumholzibacteria bacterium]|nr:hypothetical protein [Candidatus Krumholzibacteria bacterium]HRX51511.1 hypothetical protein [Candidatus Krumholzibacteria bacterium]
MLRRLLPLLFLLSLPLAALAADKAAVGTAFTYQGSLTENGVPVDGTVDLVFTLYNASIGGSAVGTGPYYINGAPVDAGRFTAQLDFGPGAFDGQQRWLEIQAAPAGSGAYQVLSPRRPLTAAPHALRAQALDGPANVTAAVPGGPSTDEPTAVLYGHNNHVAVDTEDITYGVVGSVESTAYLRYPNEMAAGVLGVGSGTNAAGVRGVAGDVTALNGPLGRIGVVGYGSTRGIYGASPTGAGIYAYSTGNYGLWAQSQDYRGATGRTNRTDNNYGLYTNDNLYSLNVNLSGAVMQVAVVGAGGSLEAGDVVVFSGLARTASLEVPLPEVRAAGKAADPAVAGVVYGRLDPSFLDPGDPDSVTPAPDGDGRDPAAPGDYVLLVVQGPALAKVDAAAASLAPGSLVTAGSGGRALAAGDAPGVGTVLGKLLEPGSAGSAYVFVTLK